MIGESDSEGESDGELHLLSETRNGFRLSLARQGEGRVRRERRMRGCGLVPLEENMVGGPVSSSIKFTVLQFTSINLEYLFGSGKFATVKLVICHKFLESEA